MATWCACSMNARRPGYGTSRSPPLGPDTAAVSRIGTVFTDAKLTGGREFGETRRSFFTARFRRWALRARHVQAGRERVLEIHRNPPREPGARLGVFPPGRFPLLSQGVPAGTRGL